MSETTPRRNSVFEAVAWSVTAGLVLLASVVAGAPVHATLPLVALTFTVAAMTAFATGRAARRTYVSVATGVVGSCLACWLLAWASYPGAGVVLAALAGASAGLIAPRESPDRPGVAVIAVASTSIALLRFALGLGVAAALVAGIAVLAGAAAVSHTGERRQSGPTVWPAVAVLVVWALFSVAWIGSSSPRVEWFGALAWHGPRTQPLVALTFDDGPNRTATLAVADMLEAHGARGTFFEVGKAVALEPTVSRALVERGHTVGNHSYQHSQWGYLDPRYPELGQTEDELYRATGVCPALFRPPHGNHTPFMSHKVEAAGMRLVTWDVSAADWSETDSSRLASAIVNRAQPGSVILLHDSIDGDPEADRSVLLAALPAILDGLAKKGLTAVTLDRLLGVPAYLDHC